MITTKLQLVHRIGMYRLNDRRQMRLSCRLYLQLGTTRKRRISGRAQKLEPADHA